MIAKDTIPRELMAYRQWVCWCYVETGRLKPDKRPMNPINLHNAGVAWPNTWSSFDTAYATYQQHAAHHAVDGIGFVLTPADPIVGVDLDACITAGEIAPHAQQIIASLDSYTEVSPSGTGLRILVACQPFLQNTRTQSIELYSQRRWVSITGNHVVHTPPTITPVDVAALTALIPPPKPQLVLPAHERQFPVDDRELWERIFRHDRFGADHHQRFQGSTALDGGDHSMTVIRLLNCLARWTRGDAQRMRRMMLMSPLANDKWVSKRGNSDWIDVEIADAIAFVTGGRR